ncbi:MAG: tRNA lysidine(34) synthetase TilS [Pseudomonadota bacterium]
MAVPESDEILAEDSLTDSLIETLASLFDDYPHISIGVSGGSDSLALLILMTHAARLGGGEISVLTVDHGMRAASANEARFVSELCADLDVPHKTLQWTGEKPSTGRAARAREERYRLMTRYCVQQQIPALAVAHTGDDQAETLLMRLKRAADQGSRRGMSGMSKRTLMSEGPGHATILLRPLLQESRAALQIVLKSEGIPWIDDPTNLDMDYERVRMRAALEDAGDLKRALLKFGAMSGRYRHCVARDAADLINGALRPSEAEGVVIDRKAFVNMPQNVSELAFQAILSVIGGRDHLVPSEALSRALSHQKTVTLARCVIRKHPESFVVAREKRDVPPVPHPESVPLLWDNRYWILPDAARGLDASGNDDAHIAETKPVSGLIDHDKDIHTVRIYPRLGAFQTFVPEYDWRLRRSLGNAVRTLVHNLS